jgi:hypothetical protein
MPSLNQYRGLFRDTLEVPNATVDMLVIEWISTTRVPVEDKEEYEYVKELVQEVARLRPVKEELLKWKNKICWPCGTPICPHELCSIGSFYVNDRQDLFDIFSDSHTFLDFDFSTSKKVANLLRIQDCKWFLSENVLIETEAREPLERNHGLTQDFRSRADALLR